MAVIPAPKTHDDVAMNQHLIPRCYMKAWKHNSGKNPSITCQTPAKKYKLYKSSINKSIHFV